MREKGVIYVRVKGWREAGENREVRRGDVGGAEVMC